MPLPNPTTSWKFIRAALRGAEFALPAGWAYLESLLDADETPSDLAWVRAVMTFSRATPTGTFEDKSQFKLDLVNITGGALDTSWTSGDLATVSTDLQALLTALQAITNNSVTFDSIRYYAMGFNPSDPGPANRGAGAGAFLPSGPPLRVDTFTKQGAGAATTPYQVAATVTFNTGWPKHWGRIYLPGPYHSAAGATDSYGRFVSAYRTALSTAVGNAYSALAGHDFLVVVPVTSVGKLPFHALLGVDKIVVDDIPDVQRSRRPRQAAARTTVEA